MPNSRSLASMLFVVFLCVCASFSAHAYDLMGSDIAGSNVSNPDQCAAACAGNPACLAWTFVRAGLKGPSARCFLKNPVPAPSFNAVCLTNFDCVSGFRQASWCGDKAQGDVLTCATGTRCNPRTSKSCSGWWIFRGCTTTQTTDYFCTAG